jgi:hypothetical protein
LDAKVDRQVDRPEGEGPLERELRRARAERRWEDADELAREIEARGGKVVSFSEAAARQQAKR